MSKTSFVQTIHGSRPHAAIDGFLRPLFFFRDLFEAQLKELTQQAEQKRGTNPLMIARLAREGKTPGVSTVRELIAEPLKNWRISYPSRGR